MLACCLGFSFSSALSQPFLFGKVWEETWTVAPSFVLWVVWRRHGLSTGPETILLSSDTNWGGSRSRGNWRSRSSRSRSNCSSRSNNSSGSAGKVCLLPLSPHCCPGQWCRSEFNDDSWSWKSLRPYMSKSSLVLRFLKLMFLWRWIWGVLMDAAAVLEGVKQMSTMVVLAEIAPAWGSLFHPSSQCLCTMTPEFARWWWRAWDWCPQASTGCWPISPA